MKGRRHRHGRECWGEFGERRRLHAIGEPCSRPIRSMEMRGRLTGVARYRQWNPKEGEDLRHGDWLPSGSHFDRSRFERAWGAVAKEIAKVAAA